jgi:4-hydroxy-3-polyprenylbenzoate decarboxylase
MKQFIVGITGATGSIYGVRLVEELIRREYHVFLTITRAGQEVIATEMGIQLQGRSITEQQEELVTYLTRRIHSLMEPVKMTVEQDEVEKCDSLEWVRERLHLLPIEEIGACIASGSFLTEGMAVVPCSMSTLSGIAHGRSSNLLERAADVVLKEGRSLLVAPREMPLNTIHLENMLTLSRMGVAIVPPMPGFYHHPETIEDMVNFVVGKILDRLRIPNQLFDRWEG